MYWPNRFPPFYVLALLITLPDAEGVGSSPHTTKSITVTAEPITMTEGGPPANLDSLDSLYEHKRRLNRILDRVKTLDEVDTLAGVKPGDKAWLKAAFAKNNPEKVLRHVAEKKRKARK